jgi:hypothetical protein
MVIKRPAVIEKSATIEKSAAIEKSNVQCSFLNASKKNARVLKTTQGSSLDLSVLPKGL